MMERKCKFSKKSQNYNAERFNVGIEIIADGLNRCSNSFLKDDDWAKLRNILRIKWNFAPFYIITK
jgi:hypothetical protein